MRTNLHDMDSRLARVKFISNFLKPICSSSLIGLLLIISSISGYSQTVSIGLPVDGVEGTSNASFTVFIEGGGVNNTGYPISGVISYIGTAIYGNDFTGTNYFSIPTGMNSVQISLSVVDENFIELTETVMVTISGINVGTIGTAVSTFSIIDDDISQIEISIGSPVDVVEGTNNNMTFEVFFEGGLTNHTGSGIIGDITYSGTATDGVDFSGFTSFSINSYMNSTTVPIGVVDDAIIELNETVVVTISNPSLGAIIIDSSTATIFDDDSGLTLVSIGLSGFGSSCLEGTTNTSFNIFMADGSANTSGAPVTGTIMYSGTGTFGVDYTAVTNFSIPNGSPLATIDVTVIDDALLESTETVIATISNLSTGIIVNESQTASIYDDESDSLLISIGSPVDAIEGTSDVTFEVSILGGTNTSGSSIFGSLNLSGSTAIFGADFVPLNTFVIPDGASSTTVTFTIIDDTFLEPTEEIIASIQTVSIGTIVPQSAVANIYDDDSGQYSMSISSTMDGTEGGADVAFTVLLDNGVINNTGGPITGMINYSGTADTGNDLINTPNTFFIANGDNSTTILLSVNDDMLVECAESVVITISNPNFGTISGAQSQANIIDDECANATISIHSPSDGGELTSDVQFIVSFDGGLLNGSGSFITGTLDLSGGTATPGVDFVDQQIFQIVNGGNSTVINVSIIDEFDIESTESIVATISNPTIGMIGNSTSTAYVVDNDSISGIDPVENLDLTIYPNPMSSNLSFKTEHQMKSYSIVDLKGRELSIGEINATQFMLDTKFLVTGVYVVTVIFDNGNTVSKRMIKN